MLPVMPAFSSPPRSDQGLVVFRYQPKRSVLGVDLRGDMTSWSEAIEMKPSVDRGWLEASLRLSPGSYCYKFRLPGDDWQLDPQNPRTRSCDGVRNSLLIVGGTDEPVMHAPVNPYVFLEDDGRLCIRAGLRRAPGHEELLVQWTEGQGTHRTRMSLCAQEDEHLLFEAHLPVSAKTLEYLFVLSDGRVIGRSGGLGQAFSIHLRGLRPSTPEWWREAVLYTIFVDRFRIGGTQGRWPIDPNRLLDGSPAGGDLRGITEVVPYLAELGVSVLHLTPIVAARSSHRYDMVEPRQVDPTLGGEPALKELIAQAHAHNLRVLLDVTLTHVHRDFFAFKDVREKGPRSRYWDWFKILRYPFIEGYGPGYEHYQKGQWQEPLLNTDQPEVMDYLVQTFEHWTQLGADGFRLDAAADVPPELVSRISDTVRRVRQDTALFGEVTVDNTYRWRREGLDAVTDFIGQQALYDWLWRGAVDPKRVAEVCSRRRFWRGAPGWAAIGFTATHDQPRLLTLTGDPNVSRLGQLMVLMRAEVPAIYYGDEVGLHSNEPAREFEDAWPDRKCMSWEQGDWDEQTRTMYQQALSLRRQQGALCRGDEQLFAQPSLDGQEQVLVIRRSCGSEVVDVLLHKGPSTCQVSLPKGAPAAARELMRLGQVELSAETVTLGPWSAVVLRRERDPEAAQAWSDLVENSSALCGLAFREGMTEAVSLPVQLYLTITEACNVRCAHCLNYSPLLTQSGQAREMKPWVLDRLQDTFAAAHYFGFSHGGESLVSPLFFEALRQIAKCRKSRPGRYDVHLLSNGKLLSSTMVQKLIDHGVSSLAVSLDGAKEQTQSRIRPGAELQTVLKNVRQAVELRSRIGADLRIGLSVVACESNVSELFELGHKAVELGVDWLKIEELVPATAFARQEMLAPRDKRLLEAMTALRLLLGKHRVVLVDHLSSGTGCDCQAKTDARLGSFRQADNFANRAHFHPCRAAWELACVDPDGTVHAVDYHHPALGTLQHKHMLEIWDSPVARRLRLEALQRVAQKLRCTCDLEHAWQELSPQAPATQAPVLSSRSVAKLSKA